VDAIKRRRSQSGTIGLEAVAELPTLTEDPCRVDIGEALGHLKTEHREVLVLRFIEDRSIRDVATLMGKSEGAVKVLQLRALRSLRKRMGGSRDGR
jgi:RNA polymerase sigma-70 factor (ECF subfamily)